MEQFHKRVEHLCQDENLNCSVFTKKTYDQLLEQLKILKDSAACPDSSERSRLKRFAVQTVGGYERVVKNGTNLPFLHMENVFNALHQIHVQLKHPGRTVMEKEMRTKYASVARGSALLKSLIRLTKYNYFHRERKALSIIY